MNQFEKDWNEVKKADRRIDDETDRRLWHKIERATEGRTRRRQKMYWAAAVLIPLLGLAFFYQPTWSHHKDKADMLVLRTGNETKTYRLADGSTVTMQPYSKLTMDKTRFGKAERPVEFTGKAFFDIAKDKSRPFRIDAHGFKVQVLGTRFFLDQKSADQSVALKEGKVKIERKGKITYLLPDETWVNDASDSAHHYYGASKTKTFTFNGEHYEEAIRRLEETYHIRIQYPDRYRKEKVQGSFTGNLKEVLDIISYPFNLKAEKISNQRMILK